MTEHDERRREYVYVMGAPISPTVKIGRSVHPDIRLGQVQETVDFPLQLMWTTPGGNEMERGLHHHFAPQRRHGEWFELPFDDAVQLVRGAIAANSWETESFPPPRKWRDPHTGVRVGSIYYMASGDPCTACGHAATWHGENSGRCWLLGEVEWWDCPCTGHTTAPDAPRRLRLGVYGDNSPNPSVTVALGATA